MMIMRGLFLKKKLLEENKAARDKMIKDGKFAELKGEMKDGAKRDVFDLSASAAGYLKEQKKIEESYKKIDGVFNEFVGSS